MAEGRFARTELVAGWPVIVASMAGLYIGATITFSIGAFIAPLEQEFGWTRAQITIGVMVITFTGAIISPAIGMIVDRLGPRRLGVPGSLIFAAFFSILGLTTGNIWVWWGLWFLLGFAFIALAPLIWTTAVASTFDRQRGIALAIALCGNGLAATFAPPLATWAIDTVGWRSAFPMIGLIMGLGAFPILYFGLHSGADKAKRVKREKPISVPPISGVNARDALRSAQFVKLGLAAFLFTFAAIGIVPNLIPILTSFEISRMEAAAIAGAAGIASIIGRLVTGVLLDRFNPDVIAGTVVILPIFSCLLLLWAPGDIMIAVMAAIVIGVSLGSEVDVMAFMTARLFGMARYGTIFGVVSGLWSLAAGTGPLTVNHIYDVTRGYELALQSAIPLFAVTSILMFTLGKPREFDVPVTG